MNYNVHIKKAIENATKEQSKLSEGVLMIDGMSSVKGRHLLNNLCSFDGAVYLEIGSWKGSTVISAAYQNPGKFYAIDNFRAWFKEKESPALDFYANKKKFEADAKFEFFERDSWKFDLSLIKEKVNVYFYDGDHTLEGTKKAFTYYNPVFADKFIMIMDDWNRSHIKQSTLAALKNYKVLHEFVLKTPANRNDPHGNSVGSMTGRDVQTWWNGLYIAIVEKKS